MAELRVITYLAPSLPIELYELLCRYLERRLGVSTSLVSEPARSGPPPADNPFSRGEVDVGFMCAPCFLGLAEMRPSPVELLGAAPVYDDPRCGGRPVYFSDVVVRRASGLRSFADLRGKRWGFNDALSLSGYHALFRHLAALGLERSFLGEACAVGSHLRALDAVAGGEIAFAAIDSCTLAAERARRPKLIQRLHVVESIGPHPVQPVVVRAALPGALKNDLAAALLATSEDPIAEPLRAFQILRFVPVTARDYTRETIFGPRVEVDAA
jgi:phosphonate transport system substrate-binding protein